MKRTLLLSLCLLVLVLGACLFPGDTHWMEDQPSMIGIALQHNTAGDWAKTAQASRSGLPYGPLPVWVYQVYFRYTNDLVLLVVLKAIFIRLSILVGTFWLLRALALPLVYLFIPLVSPFLFYYSRDLWDNNFLIPFSIFLVAAFAEFIKKPSGLLLFFMGVLCAFALNVHLMAVNLILPFVVTLLWTQRQWLKSHWKVTIITAATAFLILFPYLQAIVSTTRELVSYPQAFKPLGALQSGFWLFRLFSSISFFEYILPGTVESLPLWGKGIFYLLLLTSIPMIFAFFTGLKKADKSNPMTVLLWGTVLTTIAVHLVLRIRQHPHHVAATWPMGLYACILGLEEMRKRISALMKYLNVYYATQVTFIFSFVLFIHLNGGSQRVDHGPVLHELIRIAEQIPKNSRLVSVPELYDMYPKVWRVTRELYFAPDSLEKKDYAVVFKKEDGKGWMELTEVHP